MYLSDVCNGWQINATVRRSSGVLAQGFISVGSAVRVNGGEPVSHQFDDIGGPFPTEQEALENALRCMRAWAKLER